MKKPRKPQVYGMVGSFKTPTELIHAAEQAKEAGYRRLDAFSPFPVHGLAEAIEFKDERVPVIFFLGAVLGFFTGMGLQIYTSYVDYPLNIGGKPFFSWPSFFPVAYECTILFSALIGTISMIALNGLPLPYHPVFGAKGFDRASQDRFFLAVEAKDKNYNEEEIAALFKKLGAEDITSVRAEEV